MLRVVAHRSTRTASRVCDPDGIASSSGDDQPLSARELARRAGVSEGTIRNWAKLDRAPLEPHRRRDDRGFTYSVAQLRRFCVAHPELRATRRAIAHLDDTAATPLDAASLRAAVAIVRAATVVHLDSVRATADHAHQTASAYREHLDALATALDGLDVLLARLAPSEPSL